MTHPRAEYVAEVADLLWPPPQTWEIVTGGKRRTADAWPDVTHSFILVPSAARPRIMLPSSSRLAAAAVRYGPGGHGAPGRWSRRALEATLRTGLGSRIFRDRLVVRDRLPGAAGSLTHLLDDLAGADGGWAMPVTRARANRKPVVQVLHDSGVPAAFVKIGTNPLTRDLVHAEARVLTRLARGLEGIEIPRVVDARDIGGLAVLVLAPLAAAATSVELSWEEVVRVAHTLAGFDGVTRQPLNTHPYWRALRARLDGEDARSTALARAWQRLDLVSDIELAWGAWHGDFAPWNMSRSGRTTVLWDFERFQSGVPMGLDLVHYDVQTRVLRPRAVPYQVIEERRDAAPDVLARMGLSRAESAVVFAIYLLDVAARWIEDGQDRFGDQGVALDAMVRGVARAASQIVDDVRMSEGGAR